MRFQKELLILSPILILYLILVGFGFNPSLEADGPRYVWFANNLIQGYYSPPAPNLDLWNGPGYPLILAIFIFLGTSNFVLALANAFFHFSSVIILFFASEKVVSKKPALIIALIWGLWPFSFMQMAQVMSESFSALLVTLTMLIVTRSKSMKGSNLFLYSFFLAYLILTKVLFAYVSLFLLICLLVLYLAIKSKIYLRFAMASGLAILLTTPYLIYTHNLTGKLFYYSNSGGMSLYWMSSTEEGEFGDWNNIDFTSYCWEGSSMCNEHYFKKNHGTFFSEIRKMEPLKRDEAFKSKALENIIASPFTYLKNCYANFLRMYFNYPESYSFPRLSTLIRIVPGSILLVATLASTFLISAQFLKIDPRLQLLTLFFLVYMAGSTTLSAYPRMLNVILPCLLLIIAYVSKNLVKIKFIRPKG